MKLTGNIESVTIDRKTRKPVMILNLDRDSDEIDDLINRDKVSIEIKPYHPKRSLNANAYAWVLVNQLASALQISPEEVYRNAIKRIGGVSDIVSVKDIAVDALIKHWSSQGLGWFAEREISSRGWTMIVLYYGSSVYDTAQMSRLIEELVSECKIQGIDTMSEQERSLLLDKWTSS